MYIKTSTLKPLFIMLLLGYLLFFLTDLFSIEDKPVITLGPNQIQIPLNKITNQSEENSWESKAQQVQIAINDQVIFKEAIAMGLLETKAVQERIKKINNLTEGATSKGQETPMIYTDLLIRNYLTIMLENITKDNFPQEPISNNEITEWISENNKETTEQFNISHVFIDGFSKESEAKATALFKQISKNNLTIKDAISLGDVFYGPQIFSSISSERLSSYIGNPLLKDIGQFKKGSWLKPMPSSYGWHIFYINKATQIKENQTTSHKKAVSALQKIKSQKKWQEWLSIKRKGYTYQVILPEQWANKISISNNGVAQCKDC